MTLGELHKSVTASSISTDSTAKSKSFIISTEHLFRKPMLYPSELRARLNCNNNKKFIKKVNIYSPMPSRHINKQDPSGIGVYAYIGRTRIINPSVPAYPAALIAHNLQISGSFFSERRAIRTRHLRVNGCPVAIIFNNSKFQKEAKHA